MQVLPAVCGVVPVLLAVLPVDAGAAIQMMIHERWGRIMARDEVPRELEWIEG